MGSPLDDPLRDPYELEQAERMIEYDYVIGKMPVTVGEYRAFVRAGAYQEPHFWTTSGWQQDGGRVQPDHWNEALWAGDDRLPVVGVSWFEASAYTRWLSAATGRPFRLPTEVEWEKAARGGVTLSQGRGGARPNPAPGRRWPWGEAAPDQIRLNATNWIGHTTVVGSYPLGASPYGVLDMAGNVWEWCLNSWATPTASPAACVREPRATPIANTLDQVDAQDRRVARGGSWFNSGAQARCAYRLQLPANLRFDHDVGFRVCGPRT
jgi:formylglycine-generating enzyme required for sulfatase activity